MLIQIISIFLGCMHNKNVTPSVAKIHFEGNGHSFSATSDYVLRSVIEQEKNGRFSIVNWKDRFKKYQPETLRLDGWRLENWYATQGYIDARFIGWETHYLPQRWWHSSPQIEITGYLEEGDPVEIRSVQWTGTSKNILQRELERQLYFEEGQPLILSNVEYSEAALLSLFHNRSYARATVDIMAEIWPENCYELEEDLGLCLEGQVKASCSSQKQPICKEILPKLKECTDDWCRRALVEKHSQFIQKGKSEIADIIIQVNEGESCVFGDVLWFSNALVPITVLEEQIPFSKGDAYRRQKIATLQQHLFSLSQFSVVTVTPDLSVEGNEIPIIVNLSSRKSQQMQVGMGGQVESASGAIHGSLDYSHINLINKLLELQWNNRLGYGSYTNSFEEITASSETLLAFGGPIIESNLQVDYPRFFRPNWSIGFELNYEMGIEPTYRFSAPTVSPFFSWKKPLKRSMFASIDTRFSYYFTNFTYLDLQVPIEELNNSKLGLDVQERYSLGFLGQQIKLDGRNDPLLTRKGSYLGMDLYWAGLVFGGNYDYWQVNTDYRYFYSLFDIGNITLPGAKTSIRRWRLKRGKEALLIDGVLALRSTSGALMPYSVTDSADFAPYSSHLFLGGANDVRGWKNYHLGPYICELDGCITDGVQQNTNIIPIGGKASWVGSFEYRQYFLEKYGVALFMDAGMVWDRVSSIRLTDIQPSAGTGLRYISPIGPVRLDVACRLKEETIYLAEDRCRVHFAFSEAY